MSRKRIIDQEEFDKIYIENDVLLSESKTITTEELILATINRLHYDESKTYNEIIEILTLKIREIEKEYE